MTTVWTIGHSNHGWERFADLLAMTPVELVADVRSYPHSRVASWSNKGKLEPALRQIEIGYTFLGDALGGRPSDGSLYDDAGHALYGLMAGRPQFHVAIESVLTLAREYRLALLCSEGDPSHCHRRLLVGNVLCEHGATLEHILPNGSSRSEQEVRPSPDALFDSSWRSVRPMGSPRRG
jgi:uncharacterized protein (DUF488 family)